MYSDKFKEGNFHFGMSIYEGDSLIDRYIKMLPVVASTKTSLFFKNNGIVAACTGVDLINLSSSTANRVSLDSLGSKLEKIILLT